MKTSVLLEGEEYDYNLIFKKVKNITLRISAVGDISVTAPVGVQQKIIEQFMVKKQRWIVDKLNKRREAEAQKCDKDISILGNEYNIEIINSKERKVYFYNDTIVFELRKTDNFDKFSKTYQRWYRELSEQVIKEHCNLVYSKLTSVGIPNATIKIRTMKARWGSCYFNKNLIVLNRHLVQLPEELINHVILHEYGHFMFHNHGKEFRNFLKQLDNNSDDYEKLLRHKTHDELDLNAIFFKKGR